MMVFNPLLKAMNSAWVVFEAVSGSITWACPTCIIQLYEGSTSGDLCTSDMCFYSYMLSHLHPWVLNCPFILVVKVLALLLIFIFIPGDSFEFSV